MYNLTAQFVGRTIPARLWRMVLGGSRKYADSLSAPSIAGILSICAAEPVLSRHTGLLGSSGTSERGSRCRFEKYLRPGIRLLSVGC